MNNGRFLDDEKRELLKRNKCKGFTADQFDIFMHAVEMYRLDPFSNQIYGVMRSAKVNGEWEKRMTVQTGIDGFRLIADRTEVYAGNEDPVFDEGTDEYPASARATVYKIVAGVRCPFTATARWSEYYPGEKAGMMWLGKPHLMLGKCAESLALRKAFPAELSGIYTDAEMDKPETADGFEDVPEPAKPDVDMDKLRTDAGKEFILGFDSPEAAMTKIAIEKNIADEAQAYIIETFEARDQEKAKNAVA